MQYRKNKEHCRWELLFVTSMSITTVIHQAVACAVTFVRIYIYLAVLVILVPKINTLFFSGLNLL